MSMAAASAWDLPGRSIARASEEITMTAKMVLSNDLRSNKSRMIPRHFDVGGGRGCESAGKILVEKK